MQATVHIVLDDDRAVALHPGDLIGRTAGAALSLDDGRISEAHALVSLRGGELRLLALRGLFVVDEQLVAAVTLADGIRVELAPGLGFRVTGVTLPDHVLSLSGDGLQPQVLASLSSLLLDPEPRLSPRYEPAAAAVLWNRGEGWRLQRRNEEAQPLAAGSAFEVEGRRFVVGTVSLAEAGLGATDTSGTAPLTIEVASTTVRLQRRGEPALSLRGHGATIVRELVEFAGPVHWYTLARQVWPDSGREDRARLRARLDTAVKRLRIRLRESGVGSGLISATQTGQLELLLQPGDHIVESA